MIKKIDNDSITVKMDFDDFAILSGFDSIEEMMKCFNTGNEREAIVMSAKETFGYIDD